MDKHKIRRDFRIDIQWLTPEAKEQSAFQQSITQMLYRELVKLEVKLNLSMNARFHFTTVDDNRFVKSVRDMVDPA